MGIGGTSNGFPQHPADKPILPGSYRTTSVGVIVSLTVLLNVAKEVIQAFPENGGVGDLLGLLSDHGDTIVLALGNLGLGLFGRDNKVSSEKAGAK